MVNRLLLWPALFFLVIPIAFSLTIIPIYPKNNTSIGSLIESVNTIILFVGKSITFLNEIIYMVSLLVIIISIFVIWRLWEKRVIKFVFFSTIFVTIGSLVHGDVPSHYLIPVLPVPILLVSLFLSEIKIKTIPLIIILTFIFASSTNYWKMFLEKERQLIADKETGVHFVPLILQREASRAILDDSKGSKIRLKRVGPYDYFEEDYSQNYSYLLWYYGKKTTNTSDGEITYTIYEGQDVEGFEKIIYSKKGLVVTREL